MIGSLPLGFAQPLVLLGLLSLPVLWWLLRLIPPRPRRLNFPPTRLLFDIAPKEETPARTPWWLTALRLALTALMIIAAAGPLWNPPIAGATRTAPIALLIDDSWAAAGTWDARMRTAEDIITQADADHRGVAVIPVSESGRDISLESAGAARIRVGQIKPKPYTIDRTEALPALAKFFDRARELDIVWLCDGVDTGRAAEFTDGLKRIAGPRPVSVINGGLKAALALNGADNAPGALTVKVLRAAASGTEDGSVRALDLKGLPLGEASFAFKSDERITEARLELPVEIRNDIARLEIVNQRSAGGVELLDKSWRRRTIGVVSGSSADTAQPLLASTFYLSRALAPFADLRRAETAAPSEAIKQFIDQKLPMLILADVGNVPGDVHDQLAHWVEEGGVLVRFAGPRLAAGNDDLVPVELRRGGRTLGGSLSWDQPQPLAAFGRESPFAGMPVPDDVTVNRQVLAEPDSELADHTWSTLTDGTPLVTAARHGKGLIVLFHVTADTRWSDLPLSGTFVDMLKRIVGLTDANGTAQSGTGNQNAARDAIPPARVLDGFGAFGPAPPNARPIPAGFTGRADADHPPGFYGPPEGLVAINTLAASDRLATIDFAALTSHVEPYRVGQPVDLRGIALLAAFTLLVGDAIVVFLLTGGLHRLRSSRRIAAALIIGALAVSTSFYITRASADQASDDFAMKATLETRLAYVITGDAEVDAISKAGLQGLTLFLAQRTALEAEEPIGVDIGRDELAFFPLIYWPMAPNVPKPSAEALARIDTYMKQGGTVLFDTRDAIVAPPGPNGEARTPNMAELRAILSSLDIPELEPVPRDHVLTKTFFLLHDFPGRFNSGQLWVEAIPDETEDEQGRPARGGDGVSSILITSNDLAGAWAARPDGQPMLPLADDEPRQREFAFRAGVNIVMYTLTGNYKADQVHVPALLERLGQ